MVENIIFENLDPNNLVQAKEYVQWTKDQVMINNWAKQKPDISLKEYTLENFKEDFSFKENGLEKDKFMMKINGIYVGYGQIIIDHPVGLVKNKRVSWPSLAIGNSLFRSKGYGKAICQKIYELSKYHQCEAIEAGVFEFNVPMKKILINNGFKLIGVKENITFTNGSWHNSEHYILEI